MAGGSEENCGGELLVGTTFAVTYPFEQGFLGVPNGGPFSHVERSIGTPALVTNTLNRKHFSSAEFGIIAVHEAT